MAFKTTTHFNYVQCTIVSILHYRVIHTHTYRHRHIHTSENKKTIYYFKCDFGKNHGIIVTAERRKQLLFSQ